MGTALSPRQLLVRAAHQSPLLSGNTRVAVRKPAHVLLSSVSWPAWAELRDQQRLLVPGDSIGRTIYLFGDYDPKVSLVVSWVLRPGDCVLDIGANVGIVTLHSAKLVGPDGVVVAFEPQVELAELLRRSASANGRGNVTVHAVALGERDERLALVVPRACLGAASLVPGQVADGDSTLVEVVQGDRYLPALELPPVRLMKIDVEGFEAEVLKGAQGFLARTPPAVVIFEEHEKPATQAKSVQLLELAGYTIYGLPKALFRLRPARLRGENANRFDDFVAVHKDARHIEALERRLAGGPRSI